nr:MAG TPA: hypothetical protein [Caudoviricetes sp.]
MSPQSYRGSRSANGHCLVIIWSKNISKKPLTYHAMRGNISM